MILYHYSINEISLNYQKTYAANTHPDKPDGLWLSANDRSHSDSWFRYIRDQVEEHEQNGTPIDGRLWCNFDVRYETKLSIPTPTPDGIKVIESKGVLDEFIDCYLEQDCRRCERLNDQGIMETLPHNPSLSPHGCLNVLGDKCSYCVGRHIRWESVKNDYDGIVIDIDPWPEISNRSGKAKYHWNVFDRPSWCIWNMEHLVQIGDSEKIQGLDYNWNCKYCIGKIK